MPNTVMHHFRINDTNLELQDSGARAEISNLKGSLNELESSIKSDLQQLSFIPNPHWNIGKFISAEGVISDSQYSGLTDIIACQSGDKLVNHTPTKDSNNKYFIMYLCTYTTTTTLNDTFVERIAMFVSGVTSPEFIIGSDVTGYRILFGRLSSSSTPFTDADLNYVHIEYFQKGASIGQVQDLERSIQSDLETMHENLDTMSGQITSIESSLESFVSPDADVIMVSSFVNGERWTSNTANPTVVSADWKRSANLIPVKPYILFHCLEALSGEDIRLTFFTEDKTAIGTMYIFTGNVTAPCISPANAAYFGFSVPVTKTDDSLTLITVGDGKCQSIDKDYKGNLVSYFVMTNRYMTASYGIANNTNYDLIVIPNPNCDKVYTSFNDTPNFIAQDSTDTKTTLTPVGNTGENYSKICDIPVETKVLFMNRPKSTPLDVDGNSSAYLELIRPNDTPLSQKKVLCIGDSITYIDQHNISSNPDTGASVGWQKALKDKGAYVSNAGMNGYAYATGTTAPGSIYDGIVTNQYSMVGYDYVLLFGGINDVQRKVEIGTPSMDNFDSSTLCGAFCGIVDYIKHALNNCQVILITPIRANISSATFEKVKPYRDALIACAELWSIPCIDMTTLSWVIPGMNSAYFLYDNLHPNSRGMKMMGDIIANKILYGGDYATDYGLKTTALEVQTAALAEQTTALMEQFSGMTVDEGSSWEE